MEQKDVRKQLLPLMFEMGRLLKSEAARENVLLPSYLHVETLRYIKENGMPSMSEIAEYLKVAPPTATALINPFVKEGILERITDPKDRRRVRLTLSTKGDTLLVAAMKGRELAFARVLARLSTEDCEALVRILTRMTRINQS